MSLTTDHSRAEVDGAHSHGPQSDGAVIPQSDRAERATSFDVADFAVPNGREEEWRFTPIKKLARIFAAEGSSAHLGWTTELPAGVTVEEISAAEARDKSVFAPGDRTSAAATSLSEGAILITIPDEFSAADPVIVDLAGAGEDVVWGQILVQVGANAQASVVLTHSGTATYSAYVSVDVADGANLTFVSVQDWDATAIHLAENALRVAKDATLKHVVMTFGGEIVRIGVNAQLVGEGANLELIGAYFTDAGQHQEHRLFVDHAVPRARSRATYKGALQGEGAHSVWVGDVLIRAVAEGTDTYELNRNLLLTEGARADSVPNLEIETGEIEGAGHASATGRFDDEQLFYLQARGIPEAEARRLVVHGFFAELVREIGIPSIEARLLESIEAELAVAVGKSTGDDQQ
ncbi:Fe-S cluster assembly protein SufD [Rarobacter faecitabidus]|uniref:Iron-regulated ABC transporter permease protein SufD n=1 Tax=Rarobacter faecitabidus TaxID=13243 RepID=A0A542ZVB1_RARFA|nr:Fe-S cluster assembly protein SufD [Rarobacter faecitabidus]TQL64298.1 iron-regulated ABC transporter permease protein SufD [Rarobacter faecitabidus]